MRICTSPSWRIASCAAVSAGRSRRTNNGPPGRVDPDELAVIIERDDCAVVVEFEQQGVDRLHPSELVGAGEAGEPQHGHHGAVYDDLLADRGGFDAALGRGGGAGADGGRSRRRRGCLDTDAADRAGGCIDVPRTAVGDDHARTRRQRGGRGGGEQFGGTLDEALAAGVPARLAALHQRIQHIGNGRRSDAGAGFGAFAQQVGDVAGRRRGFVVRGDGPWRGGGGDTAALADQQGGDEAGVRVIAGRQFEYDPLALFFGGGIGEGVEEGLLFGAPQCREAVECGERRRRQMFAACNAAGAAVVEHHAAPEQGGGDRDGVGEGLVLDGAGDGVGV